MQEKQTLTFLVGPSLSGKSYYAKQHQSEDCVVISSDAKRLELGITTYDPTTHGRVFKECHKDICKALKEGKDVIFDATNLYRRQRNKDISFYRKNFPNVHIKGVVFDINPHLLQKRISTRNPNDINYVSPEVIDKQIDRFRTGYPTSKEFDEIEIISTERGSLQKQIKRALKMEYGVDLNEKNISNNSDISNNLCAGRPDICDR